jgi:hypothetical protein
VDGTLAPGLSDAVGGYGEHLVLAQTLGDDADSVSLRQFDESEPANAHWCVDGVVVKSDGCGAQSFLVDDLDALCAGLDPEVVARIRELAAPG